MRFPALATSLVVHSAVLATLLLSPILDEESPPPCESPRPPLPLWPMTPRVALADARPAPSQRASSPRPDVPAAPAPHPAAAPVSFERPDPETMADPLALDETLFDPGDPFGVCGGAGEARSDEGDLVGGASPESAGGPAGPVRVGGLVQPPTKLRHVIPDYPELARRAGVQGVVVLDCLLDTGGNVSEVSVVSGHPLLKGAALDAVRSWRYTPTRLNGAPVPVLLTVTVEFRLRR